MGRAGRAGRAWGWGGVVCVLTLTHPAGGIVVVARIAQADVARHGVEAPAVLAETRPEHHTLISVCGKSELR